MVLWYIVSPYILIHEIHHWEISSVLNIYHCAVVYNEMLGTTAVVVVVVVVVL